ncbi:MAG: hypothetical protein CM1200mP35_03240 [Chloroflexota bacterium]|nr:MAG: hypothetical protein CM1200mP35_03240 [Chloroflexota bacterium]
MLLVITTLTVGREVYCLTLNRKREEIFLEDVGRRGCCSPELPGGAVQKLGLSYEEVSKRKPDIIYASLNAYGHVGPWAGRPGHEGFAQATAGMTRRLGEIANQNLSPTP